MNDPVNLGRIIGRGDREAQRIVDFMVHDGGLIVAEKCDEYFAIKLDLDEVDRLITWLTAARDKIRETDG